MATVQYEMRHDFDSSTPIRKRRKGAARLSCAECRRLKLRCDRAIPCSSCIKRGCGAICPDGSLTTGQGNRFVLASTQELHEKIAELAQRVRDLEDALRATHSQLSAQQHPLLSDELLKIKAPLQRDPPAGRNATPKVEENSADVIDAFGSLSISVSGRTKYYGSIANSWYFLQNEMGEIQQDEESQQIEVDLRGFLSPQILAKAAAFPISSVADPVDKRSSIHGLFRYLPSSDKALELRSVYYRYAAWMYNPISAESFDKEVYSQFYDPSAESPSDEPIFSHRLSVMFMVLAIGSLMNINAPAYNADAEIYHQLARAALFHHSFIDDPTLTAVQALFLMTFYLFLADKNSTNYGARWTIMGIAVKIAQSIGLHRDSGRWKVGTVETQRRRELFWELFTYDSWQCLTFGRPPSFALAHVDCKMPFQGNLADDETFHAWKHRFSSECMNLLHDQAFGARMPSYATVVQLDRKMRAFPVPPILQVNCYSHSSPGGTADTTMLTLQRHIVLAIRETTLLYLHRSFFARAISDHPKDPLGSPFGASVLAAYRSAGALVALMRNLHTQLKEPSERMWFLWTHMFSCAIVLGSIVTRCPSIGIASSALAQLDSACELFEKAARGFRAQPVLDVMIQLQQKAHATMEEYERQRDSPSRYGTSSPISPVDDNDALSVLGGKTRLRLVGKEGSVSPILGSRSPSSRNPIVPLPLLLQAENHFDPNVWEYLNSFSRAHPNEQHGQTSPKQPSPSSPNSLAQMEVPQSMFGMTGMGTSYQAEAQYLRNSQTHGASSTQNMLHSPQIQPVVSSTDGATSIPQYFHVYDYATSTVNGTQPVTAVNTNSSSGSPNMQTMWQDFVRHVAM